MFNKSIECFGLLTEEHSNNSNYYNKHADGVYLENDIPQSNTDRKLGYNELLDHASNAKEAEDCFHNSDVYYY